jgi:hypothetical protein
MPVTHKIQVFKTLTGDRFWTNVYHVNATTLSAAAAFANTLLVTFEQTILLDDFLITKTLVSEVPSGAFVDTPLSLPGTEGSGEYYPLYNTIRALISVAGGGRVDSKFYRGGISEGNVVNGILGSTLQDLITDGLSDLISDATASGVDLVDNEGNAWVFAACQPNVQMRQLHRRRKHVAP